MTFERSEVAWGTTRIAYIVRRSARRATVAVSVEPGGAVVLTAPVATPLSRLDRVVLAKARWITERIRRKSEPPPAREREYVSGESYLYLGRSYRLRVVAAEAPGAASLTRGWLVVPVARKAIEPARRTMVRTGLVAWYGEQARRRLPEMAASWARKLSVSFGDVLVRDQVSRWGSCDTKGNLRFNWRVMQASLRLVDYVVAHEVMHLRHADHTRAFWALLGRVMPDYEARREQLRVFGPELVW